MIPPKIIGIRGYKESGKDFAYTCIAQHLSTIGIECYKRAFADSLKDEVCSGYGCSRDYLELHKKDFRLILQGWGVSKRNLIRPDYWTSKWNRWTDNFLLMKPNAVVVVPDVRFKNELELIESKYGVVIHIVAINKPLVDELDTHPSETELDHVPCKIVLRNDFKNRRLLLDDLKTQLNKLGYNIK